MTFVNVSLLSAVSLLELRLFASHFTHQHTKRSHTQTHTHACIQANRAQGRRIEGGMSPTFCVSCCLYCCYITLHFCCWRVCLQIVAYSSENSLLLIRNLSFLLFDCCCVLVCVCMRAVSQVKVRDANTFE